MLELGPAKAHGRSLLNPTRLGRGGDVDVDGDPGVRSARLRGRSMVANDATRLRLLPAATGDEWVSSGPLETAAIGLETGVQPEASPEQAPAHRRA